MRIWQVAAAIGLMGAVPAEAQPPRLSLADALSLVSGAEAAPNAQVQAPAAWTGSTGHLVALVLLGVYRNTLARTDMDACAFEPSCSHFAQLAIDDAGFVRGILRGADRLLRDHPGVPYMGYNQAPDGKHFLDPPQQGLEPPCQSCDQP